jgi:hypothetical protein
VAQSKKEIKNNRVKSQTTIEVDYEDSNGKETIETKDIEVLIFKLEDRGIHRKVLLGVCVGGIAWAAISESRTQSIAAIGVTVAGATYLASTVGRTKYRKYKFLGIEDEK